MTIVKKFIGNPTRR